MTLYENKTFDLERALYNADGVVLKNCAFDGPADGESALKESKNIEIDGCFMNLRYPFWHDDKLVIKNSEMTELCRAALWYSKDIKIENTKMHGIKALRECKCVTVDGCSIISPEFGWSTENAELINSSAESEYFMMRAKNLHFDNVKFKGKYSFQYVENALIENCGFDTKDAFWHTKNVTVRNTVLKGEYLAWYSENLTLDHCKIIGTQPLCYCKGLRLIDCEMIQTDLSFEKSEVEATITSKVDSIKNPLKGHIYVPEVGEIIMDDKNAEGEIILGRKK